MTKFFKLSAIALVAIMMASCSSDDDKTSYRTNYSVTLVNHVANLLSSSTAVNMVSTGNYSMIIDSNEDDIDIAVSNITFDPRMPKVNFVFDDVDYKFIDYQHFTFSDASVSVTDASGNKLSGYTVTNFTGFVDLANGVTTFSYNVNGNYRVTATSSRFLSTLSSGTDYSNSTETIYRYQINVEDSTATLYVHNISFATGMPKLSMISIPSLKLEFNVNGYELSGTDIVPSYYNANGEATPFPDRKVTDFKASINILNKTHSVEFTAFGSQFTNSGNLYMSYIAD